MPDKLLFSDGIWRLGLDLNCLGVGTSSNNTDILERETDFDSKPIYQEPDIDSECLKHTPEAMKVQEGEPKCLETMFRGEINK